MKFLGSQLVAKKPFPIKTLRLTFMLQHPTFIEVSICIYNLTDDETFELWDSSNLIFATFTK